MPDPSFPGRDEAWLKARGGLWTAREIAQQPEMLRLTQSQLIAGRAGIEAFIAPLLQRKDLRIILTGAGTSAFYRRKPGAVAVVTSEAHRRGHTHHRPGLRAGALFRRRRADLLVSFGRSGNSPESLAAVELADSCVPRRPPPRHYLQWRRRPGPLCRPGAHGYCLLMPEATHDHGFAMTSSYSCMTLAAWPSLPASARWKAGSGAIAGAVAGVLDTALAHLQPAVAEDYERVAYLGSHVFKGLAREAGLKLLELTNGGIATLFDSPLGFRHGPKTFVNGRTLVLVFLSNNPHTRRYDIDLLDELKRDGEAGRVIAVTARGGVTDALAIAGMEEAQDIDLIFPYIAVAQIFAFQQSLRRGLTPDQPNTQGTVNRVVQGVRIHERIA
ncbi:MAG: sugar isomerase [Asticcacaulis sp.]